MLLRVLGVKAQYGGVGGERLKISGASWRRNNYLFIKRF